MKRMHLAVAAALSLVSFLPALATVTPLSQDRRVGTFASFMPAGGTTISSSDAMDAPGYGSLSEDALCHVGEEGGQVTATAVMTSIVDATGVSASVTSNAIAEISNPDDFAEGIGFSTVIFVFSVDVVTPCRLHGIATTREQGQANILFRVNGGAILLNQNPHDTTLPIDQLFSLTPGTYRLELHTGGFGQAFGDENVEAFAQYDLTLSFPNVAAVEPMAAVNTLRVVPNPMFNQAEIMGAQTPMDSQPLEVIDASGRVVRELQLGPAGSARWDGRGQDGAPLTGGVYFVRGAGSAPTRVVLIR